MEIVRHQVPRQTDLVQRKRGRESTLPSSVREKVKVGFLVKEVF